MGDFLTLLLNLGGSFLRRHDAPHLIKGIHVEGQRVEFALIVRNRRVGKTVELCKLRDIIPYFFVIGMENMRAIFMDIDSFNFFSVNVTSNIGPFIHYQNCFTMSLGLMGKDGAVQTRSNYQIIVFHLANVL